MLGRFLEDDGQLFLNIEDKLLYKVREMHIDSEYYATQRRLVTPHRIAFQNLEEYNLIVHNTDTDRFELTNEGEEAYFLGYERYVSRENQRREERRVNEERIAEETRKQIELQKEQERLKNRPFHKQVGDWIIKTEKKVSPFWTMGGIVVVVISWFYFHFYKFPSYFQAIKEFLWSLKQ